jgi:hypothetical protein
VDQESIRSHTRGVQEQPRQLHDSTGDFVTVSTRLNGAYLSLTILFNANKYFLKKKMIHPTLVGLVEAQQIRVIRSLTVY